MPLLHTVCRAEESFEVLFYQNPHPRWIIDNDTLRFLEINDAAAEAYGYSRQEFLTMTLEDLYLEEELPCFRKFKTASFNGLTVNTKKTKQVTKNGTHVYREIISYKVNFEGTVARLAMITDITERVKAEQELSNYILRMESLAFFNSHQLRKPVANILGLASLLENHENCPIAEMIRESVTELDLMIKDLGSKINIK